MFNFFGRNEQIGFDMNRIDRATDLLKGLLAKEPNDPGFNNDLGYIWADHGMNLKESERLIRRAIAEDRKQSSKENPAYLTIVILGRVITRLGTLDEVHGGILENMFASDVAFLQDLYRRINQEGHTRAAVTCPACKHEFSVDVAGGRLGES